MFNEESLFWVFPNPLGFFLMVVAFEAIPNEDFEVELAVYVGMQCGKEITWVESYAVTDYTIEDVDDLAELACGLAEKPEVLHRAKQVVKDRWG